MKIRILTSNSALVAAIQESFPHALIESISDVISIENSTCNILIIDGTSFRLDVLYSQIALIKARIIYLADRDEKDIQYPGVTVFQYDGRLFVIVDELKKLVKSMVVYKNVLAFWSPVSGAGTTTTALTVMHGLPNGTRALYLSLTDVPGIEYVSGIESSISDILPRLISGVLEPQDLNAACSEINGRYYLGGLNSYIDVTPYSLDDMKALIAMAATYFDYVVIDAGYGASLMAIAALSVSAHTYVVTTPSAIAALRYEQLNRQVYGNVPEIVMERLKLITNMDNSAVLVSSRITKMYGIKPIATVRQAEEAIGIRATYESALVYDLDTSGYRKDMSTLISDIYTEIGVVQTITRSVAGRRSILRGLFGARRL